MPKTHYAVLVTATSKTMMIDEKEVVVDLTWLKGQSGCMPVFSTKKKAEKFAKGRFAIISLEEQG